jgi:hypothetical protein
MMKEENNRLIFSNFIDKYKELFRYKYDLVFN